MHKLLCSKLSAVVATISVNLQQSLDYLSLSKRTNRLIMLASCVAFAAIKLCEWYWLRLQFTILQPAIVWLVIVIICYVDNNWLMTFHHTSKCKSSVPKQAQTVSKVCGMNRLHYWKKCASNKAIWEGLFSVPWQGLAVILKNLFATVLDKNELL